MTPSNTSEFLQKYTCEKCDFTCSKKGDWNRHLLTAKHNNQQKSTEINEQKHQMYKCSGCEKIYNERSGLWRHKKKCNMIHIVEETTCIEEESLSDKKLIMELLKSNNELHKQMIELCKDKNTVINNTTHNNNSNNQFNLQFFLNETCKDALNIDEFVNQIQLQLSDLDMIGKVGYVEGITKIFLRNLKALDVCKRPIHCSDLKREVLYIKDKGAWEKDNDDNVTPFIISNAHFYKLLFYKNYLNMYYYSVLVK